MNSLNPNVIARMNEHRRKAIGLGEVANKTANTQAIIRSCMCVSRAKVQ